MHARQPTRAARRNAARQDKTLRNWRHMGYADRANELADLPERARQCALARAEAAKSMATSRLTGRPDDVIAALRAFWERQKRTRVGVRILAGLQTPRGGRIHGV